MAFENAKNYLANLGFADRIQIFETSSATVDLAAKAVGTEPARIAKSITFKVNDIPVMIVCAGDTKVSNSKFKAYFHTRAKMLSAEEVEQYIGHGVGGVCPFGIKPGVSVYLDISLQRFETIYPACGSANSAVKLNIAEVEAVSAFLEWIDVCEIL